MSTPVIRTTALALGALLVAGCGGGSLGVSGPSAFTATQSAQTAGSLSSMTGSSSDKKRSVNLTALPVDDYYYETSGPKEGWVYSCQSSFSGGGPSGPTSLPWVSGSTWNYNKKVIESGNVTWSSTYKATLSGTKLTVTGNGLPKHTTGIYPIPLTSAAHQYDGNPNSIKSQTDSFGLPANPTVAASASCLHMGAIGIMTTGAVIFNALDAMGRDAAVHEVLDSCWGHPDGSGTYHYHTFSPCMSDPGTGHSNLLGYALDGFGIYGPRDTNGKVLTSSQLDACHGHTHAIVWNGKTVVMYHYHFTYDYPYSVGCYRGTPITTGPPSGGPPQE